MYTVRDIARIIGIAESTVRRWMKAARRGQRPLLTKPYDAAEPYVCSFFNLIEVHVIAELRRRHNVQLATVRRAFEYLRREAKVDHPLVAIELSTANRHIYADLHDDRLVDISAGGQYPIEPVILELLERVDRTRAGIVRFFPPVSKGKNDKLIMIDPRISFGRPVITGTGIPTEVIAERFRAGDPAREIAEDYDRTKEEIEAALRFERARRKAA